MYRIILCLFALVGPVLFAASPKLQLKHLQGPLYVAEDYFFSDEFSIVYLGKTEVTVVGATWTPEIAKLLATEIAQVTSKPITEVINTNYHADRAGGNAFFKSIGAHIVATRMTDELMAQRWDGNVRAVRQSYPNYPSLPLVRPDQVQRGDFELQGGRIKAFYLGPSHTPDDIFVYFPDEQVLYGGCILKDELGYLGDADLSQYSLTLQKLKALKLPIKTIVAGHYTPIHGPELIDQDLELLKRASGQRTNP